MLGKKKRGYQFQIQFQIQFNAFLGGGGGGGVATLLANPALYEKKNRN